MEVPCRLAQAFGAVPFGLLLTIPASLLEEREAELGTQYMMTKISSL